MAKDRSAARPSPQPSSGTAGFFQSPPTLPNPYLHRTFQRTLRIFLPNTVQVAVGSELATFGAITLTPEISRLVQDSESNPPRVDPLDSFGRPKNALITSEGWRALTAISHREGLVSSAYENKHGQYDRLYQFLKCNLWSPSSGGVTCPAAMQDGAAALLKRLLDTDKVDDNLKPIIISAFRRLTSRDPSHAWTSGQWMTERPGGSDVRNTETRARLLSKPLWAVASDGSPLGPWEVHGFKWFSSATDADMTVLLAKMDGSDNVSLFYLPVRKIQSSASATETSLVFNGITIQRLKNKLGTKSLPTAELILSGARAYLLGKEGQGTKEISTVLNITRIHNAVGATSAWSRSLAVATAFSRVRSAGNKLLMDTPLHVRGLAQQHVACHAYTLLTYFAVALLGRSEHKADATPHAFRLIPSNAEDVVRLLRIFTPTLKATTATKGIEGVRYALESLGGIGYCENNEVELNLAKLLRDTQVLSIWEGTADVMALDTVRIFAGRDGTAALRALHDWTNAALSKWEGAGPTREARTLVQKRLQGLDNLLRSGPVDVTYNARAIVEHIAAIGCTIMIVEDALFDQDEVAWKMAERWVGTHADMAATIVDAKDGAFWDRRIVYDVDPRSKL